MKLLFEGSNTTLQAWFWGALLLAATPTCSDGETTLFSTRFEASEGYDLAYTLAGQGGWLGDGSGGNGLVDDFIAGQGQQAYLGYWPPLSTNESELFLWQPIGFQPLAVALPLVRFSVLMSIVDSSEANGQFDNFRWSIFNTRTNQLFMLDFDNYYRDVSYLLDGTNELVVTDVTFTNDTPYTLLVTMNFAANQWSASLDHRLIATNQPITTTGALRDLGDIDAVWFIFDPENPGDNYMLFDNYTITAASLAPPRPRLQLLGRTGDGQVLLRLSGPDNTRFAIEASTNFMAWTPLRTNVTSAGAFDLIDATAPGMAARHYRARWVP